MKNEEIYDQLIASFKNSYLNSNEGLASSSGPAFVYNNWDEKKTVLDAIIKNLQACDEFLWSVAFITESGLIKLKMVLKELASRGIKGRIITTNYLNFSEPKALIDISKMPNIELRMFYLSNGEPGYHTKGYIFHYPDGTYHTIIGSSNLTDRALQLNNEWNSESICLENGELIKEILSQFEINWKHSKPIDEVIKTYQEAYEKSKEASISPETNVYALPIKPNAMQAAFILRWNELIAEGAKRGIFIAATGSGKTYATALGLQNMKGIVPKRVLYVTHRERILKQAMEAYKRVLGQNIKMTLLSGNSHKDGEFDYYFATKETLAKPQYLKQFTPDFFDVIIIDEVHKVGEKTQYQNIIKYFTPQFLLGMSATPFRSDGFDLYEQFDHNIVYSIDMEDALKARMICPFDYFGIADISNQGRAIDDLSSFNQLTSDERVDNIIEQSKYYGYCGPRLKGLIFVNRVDVGTELSNKLNQRGYKTAFLDGATPSDMRDEAIDKLESDDPTEEHYDFLLTVDIFNEGVDIPSVNQVILLRPTQSAIVFLQQLGRGLRLYDGKDYVVVLDFIGNYKGNFNISVALNKKIGSKRGLLGKPSLPPPSTVQFDPISTERLFKSIYDSKIFSANNVKTQYNQVKSVLGAIPTIIAFDKGGKLTGRVFMDYQVSKSYCDFLTSKEKDYSISLSSRAINMLRYASQYFGSGIRIHECLLLRCLLSGLTENDFAKILTKYHLAYDNAIKNSLIAILSRSFATKSDQLIKKDTYSFIDVSSGTIKLSQEFLKECQDKEFLYQFNEILSYGIYSSIKYFNPINSFSKNLSFVRYETYSRRDVCRLINHLKNEEGTINGYKTFDELKITPIFVTYTKTLEADSSTNYQDAFLDKNTFTWFTRSRRTLKSKEIQRLNACFNDGVVLLFVKKADSKVSGKSEQGFIFLGAVKPCQEPKDDKMLNGNSVVRYELKFDKEVRNDIYENFLTPIEIDKPLKKA